jgi:tetratricopeptide (TPR) repeat protein
MKALELRPDDPVVKTNLAHVYLAIGQERGRNLQYDEALEAFQKALEWNPALPILYNAEGWAYHKLGRSDDAIGALEESLRLNPGETDAYRQLGDIYEELDEPEKGIEALEKAFALHPEDAALSEKIAKLKRDREIESAYQKTSTTHFIIKFEGEEKKDIAAIVSDILGKAYSDIGSIFYEKGLQPVIVILYSEQEFRNSVHGPGWSGGIFDGKIRIPVQGSLNKPEELKRVLYHEYTHAVLHQVNHYPIPTWINEGLAMYFEGEAEEDPLNRALSEARKNGKVIPLDQLQGNFFGMSPETANLAYGESRSAVKRLIDHYGVRRVRDLIELYRGPDSFPAVFEQVFLISYEAFNHSFLTDGT